MDFGIFPFHGAMLRVGVVGCGAIGSEICRAVDAGAVQVQLSAIHDRVEGRTQKLLWSLKHPPRSMTLSGLIINSDLVVEAAQAAAVAEIALATLDKGKDLLVMSVGGLLSRPDLFRIAAERNLHIYIPSGALAGLDAVKAAAVGRVDRVTLTTSKPPRGLAGAPYVVEHKIDLEALTEPTVIFEGTAAEAVLAFPANVNVAATLSLCALGPEQTAVRVIADPTISVNIHQLEVEGEFGRMVSRTENLPSPDNPKTSRLAALSAIATLRKIVNSGVIGT